MKCLFILFIMLLGHEILIAQDTKETYCELFAQGKAFSRKVKVRVDFGQKTSFWKGVDAIRDKVSGKTQKFNSVIDALNYLGAEGWKLVNAFPITAGNQNVYHYVFKREVPASEMRDATPEDYDPDNN